MERSLMVVSVCVWLAVACFMCGHQMRPPRTAKTAAATNSPVGFMGYLLFHQVAIPNPTMASGKITMLSQNTRFIFCVVILSGRSSGALGRMEMRSSSAVSQLIMLRNRSRLPLNRMKLLPAHMELPTTTNRPGVVPLYVPAAARVSGPFLSFLGSMRMEPELRLVVAKLLALVAKRFSTVVFSPFLVSSVRESGKAVATFFRSRTMGGDS